MSEFISYNNQKREYQTVKKNPYTGIGDIDSDTKKNYDWYRYWIDKYISAFDHKRETQEEKLYKTYRGIRNKEDLDYITNMYSSETSENILPVPDIPHIPLIRRYIDHLVSTNSLRPVVYNLNYGDADAIREKDKKLVKKVTQEIVKLIVDTADKELEGKQNSEESNRKLQEEIDKITSEIHDFKTIQEIVADKCLKLAIERLNCREKWSIAFLDKTITGKQFYKCKLIRLGELPEYEIINTTDIAFSAENVDYLNKCQFVVHRRYMSYHDIVNMYGHLMTKDDLTTINVYKETATTAPLYAIEEQDLGYVGTSQGNLIEVFEVEWKTNEKIKLDELSEYGITPDEVLEDETDSKYRYYQKLHTGIRIAGSIYVKYGEVKWARRDATNISKVLLNYNGRLYNNRNNPPLSLVKDLKDLQNYYDILWYKLLEMILLSGNKGINLIEELLPTDLTIEDWLYYRKLGVARLSISNEGISEKLIGQVGQAMNNYDDTLSANGIQSVTALIQQIEKTVGDICGVPPQALGQTQQYETKANAELSVTQGSITVEVLHKDHSNFIRESLNDLLHWSKIALQKGRLQEYLLSEEEKKMMDIDWNFIDYNIFVVDSYKEEKALNTAKQIAQELVKSQQINFATLIKTLNSNSINEVKSIVDKAIEKSVKMQQANMQAEQQAEQQKLQAEMQLKQKELQLKEQELQLKSQLEPAKIKDARETKDEELEIKDRLAKVEEGYLEIAKRELDSNIDVSNRKLDSRKGRNDKNN